MKYKWNIFQADLNPALGSEQKGKRPVIVISDEDFNELMPVLTILPITSLKEGRKVYPNEVLLSRGSGNLIRDSLVLAHQIRTIAKQRLKERIGYINNHENQEMINEAIRVHLNL